MSGPRTPPCPGAGRGPEPLGATFAALGFGLRRGTAGLIAALPLTACATQVSSAVQHSAATPGFLLGVWHGFIFPVAWVLSLFLADVAVYAVPNNGGWYDFGFFVGVVFLGVGARSTRTVYVTRRVR